MATQTPTLLFADIACPAETGRRLEDAGAGTVAGCRCLIWVGLVARGG